MLIVVERRETFHYYYPMGVHPPGDLTVTYTRKKMGLDYDRFKLASVIYDRSSSEAISVIDKAIVLLISRNLVCFKAKQEGKRKLIITDQGEFVYNTYKEEMKK